jgi:hypothetical protein
MMAHSCVEWDWGETEARGSQGQGQYGLQWVPVPKEKKRLPFTIITNKIPVTKFNLGSCARKPSTTVTNYLRWSAYWEEKLLWAHSFEGFSPWSAGRLFLGLWWDSTSWREDMARKTVHLTAARKQKRGRGRTRVPTSPSKIRPSDTTASSRSYLLKVPPPPITP